ncbi:MAG TPA: hypothetical protein VNR90_06750 [Vicinamibacterales bacterium]|jgi:hypothetical protein|nr:hypothetical protein [Vicinamibacterales bacterium]
MAKKKSASKTPASQTRKKTVSVKRIVAEIDKALAKLEPAKASAQARRSVAAKSDPQSYSLDRTVMSLRAARDVIESNCVPGFDIPI